MALKREVIRDLLLAYSVQALCTSGFDGSGASFTALEAFVTHHRKGPNMRSVFSRCVIAIGIILAAANNANASVLGLDVTSDTQPFLADLHNLGWQFNVIEPITIDGLGVFDFQANGLEESHQVGLWDSNGSLLRQATVTSGSTLVASVSNAGDWRFESIAPIVLLAGTYVTSAFYPTNVDPVMGLATITTVPQISFLASRASDEAAFAQAGPSGGLVQPGIFGANIRVQSVPDPASSILLLGSSLAMLAVKRWRSVA